MNTPSHFLIAGGGLAGLSLACALRRSGHEVELHEALRYPRHRVCGEFICGVSDQDLATLGILPELSDAILLQSSTWFINDTQVLSQDLPSPARGISRHCLDQRLASQFQALGGDLHENSRLTVEDLDGHAHPILTAGRPRSGTKTWIGLKAHFSNLPLQADLEMHLGPGGYLGLTKIEEGRTNACGLFQLNPSHGGGYRALNRYLKQLGLNSLIERMDEACPDESSFCGVAGFELGIQSPPSKPHILCLGDAHSMIPPFTGNGMSMALESAAIAFKLIEDSAPFNSWPEISQAIHRQLSSQFSRRMMLAETLHPLLLRPSTQKLTALLAKSRLLPFQTLFNQLR